MTLVDVETGYPYSIYVPRKGTDKYVISVIVQFVKRLRHKVVFQTDQEHPIHAVFSKVCEQIPEIASMDHSPKHSHQSNGAVESLNGILQGWVRTMLSQLKAQYPDADPEIDVSHVLFPWLTRHVAWMRARYSTQPHGATAWTVVNGRAFADEICSFAETVLCKVALEDLSSKAAPRWLKGIWVG